MDISSLAYNAELTQKAWHAPSGSKQIIALKDCRVYFPATYLNGKLGYMDDKVNVIAYFGIVVEDTYYAVSDALALMSLTPDEQNLVRIEDGEYMELSWKAGSVITENRHLVKDSGILYEVFNEIVAKGKTPWYMSITQLADLFRTAGIHAGKSIGVNKSILSIFVASRAKSMTDRRVYFRETLKTQADMSTLKPAINPLNSVSAGATNTTSSLLGSYLREGMVSTLVTPAENNEAIEDLLRA
jgi:hypothetical protein